MSDDTDRINRNIKKLEDRIKSNKYTVHQKNIYRKEIFNQKHILWMITNRENEIAQRGY